MADKALYILAGYDEETDKRLTDMQNKLFEQGFSGVQTTGIPQHITLGSYPIEQEAYMKQLLEDMAKGTKPVEVSFNHVGLFVGARVLFAAPDISRELLGLRESFGETCDVFDWTPHNTIIIDEPETVYKALPFVIDDFVPFKGMITELHLYEFFPARHILSVKLNG